MSGPAVPFHDGVHDEDVAESADSIGELVRPRSTPPMMSQKLSSTSTRGNSQPQRPWLRFSVDNSMDARHAVDPLSRSPVIGEGDHLYTSGLRRIRQQALPLGVQPVSILTNSPRPSASSTRANSLSFVPTSPTLGSCEDLARFPSESLHSFSFAHQSEDLIHNRQNILKRSIEFMRDKLGWAAKSPMIASAQAKVEGDEELQNMMELLRRANIVPEEKSALMAGPATGPAEVEGNPFDTSFAHSKSPQFRDSFASNKSPPISDVPELSSSPVEDSRSEHTSRSATSESKSTSHSTPPPTRGPLKRTYTDTESLRLQTRIYEALAQPYIATDEFHPGVGATASSRPVIRKSSVHGHTSRYAPPAQAIFTTESRSPWTILAANDLACLVFGLTKAEVRRIGILEVVQEERREWLANKLNSGENTSSFSSSSSSSSFPYPYSHSSHGTAYTNTATMFQGSGRRVKSDAYYTGAPPPTSSDGSDAATGFQAGPNHKQRHSRGVILCGDVVPIRKRNGNAGAASLWVKEKRGGLIWVLEEISEDVVFIHTTPTDDKTERITRVNGNAANIFGDVTIQGAAVRSLIPMLPTNAQDGAIDFEKTASLHQFTAVNNGTARVPCGVEPLLCSQGRGLRISSFPHIAGIIVLSAATLRIASSNAVFSAALFGHLNPVGLCIMDLIPQFDLLLRYLTDEEGVSLVDGMVIPEHLFRKANALIALKSGKLDAVSVFSRPAGLGARHRDGAELYVDVHMRVVMSESHNEEAAVIDDPEETTPTSGRGEVVYALWVTYSRKLHIATADPDPLLLPEERRPNTPPKRPSPGQPSSPVVLLDAPPPQPREEPTISLLTKHLADLTTPPSSEGEDETSAPEKKSPVAEAMSPLMSKRKKTIQDFIILEDMGQGAYGQVKLARYKRQQSNKRVVLKYVTKRRILVDTWTRDRRLGTVPLEIHVLDYLRRDGLKHPNIVEMTDFFEDDVNYYIEMVPHGLPGMDLFDYIELKVNMDEDECRSIFVQVARALHHLHTKAGVVHRDIKDENVVLDGEGNIKLIDFGSASYIKNGPFDVFVGTIDYAAPEVLAGKSSYKGKEQDVWALGVLLYTICYKENPFYNIDEIMDRELRIPFIMSEASLDLIKLMLDRDVDRRPTIEQVLAHSWFAGLPGPEEALLAESPVKASVLKEA